MVLIDCSSPLVRLFLKVRESFWFPLLVNQISWLVLWVSYIFRPPIDPINIDLIIGYLHIVASLTQSRFLGTATWWWW